MSVKLIILIGLFLGITPMFYYKLCEIERHLFFISTHIRMGFEDWLNKN